MPSQVTMSKEQRKAAQAQPLNKQPFILFNAFIAFISSFHIIIFVFFFF